MVQGLNLRSWIRMIENSEKDRISEKLGIDFVQGMYFGKILPLEEIIEIPT